MSAQQVIVIGQGSSNSYPPCVFVDTISERNALTTNKIVIVRNAYKGDSSVVKGWAAYVLDPAKKTWSKIIEQESVDGPWGVNEEIKRSLVTKDQFNELKKIVERLDPTGGEPIDWLKEPENGGIANKPNIEATVDPETEKKTWTANFDHLEVGDVKDNVSKLKKASSLSATINKLNALASAIGAVDDGTPDPLPNLPEEITQISEEEEWSETTLVDKINECVAAINKLIGRVS